MMRIFYNYLFIDDFRGFVILSAYEYIMNSKYRYQVNDRIRNPKRYKRGKPLRLNFTEFDIERALKIYKILSKVRWTSLKLWNPAVQIILINDRKAELTMGSFIKYRRWLKEQRAKFGHASVLDVFSTLKQPYFFPGYSPHPFFVSTGLYFTVSNFIHWLWFSSVHGWWAFHWFLCTLYAISYWIRDLCVESSYLLKHTTFDNRKFKFAFFLFLASEVMFFWSFFWAFFHSSLSPGVGIGFVWPPYYIHPIKWYHLPLVNTGFLVGSGFWAAGLTTLLKTRLPLIKHTSYEWFYMINFAFELPWRHRYYVSSIHYIIALYNIRLFKTVGHKLFLVKAGYWAYIIYYGFGFLCTQFIEYTLAPFSINSGIYGSCFFMITGLHGVHVLCGWIFLLIQRYRFLRNGFRVENYLGIRMAIWYWHFVDIIWIIVMIWVYWWGS